MRNGQFAVFAVIAALVIGAAAAVIAISIGVLDAGEIPSGMDAWTVTLVHEN